MELIAVSAVILASLGTGVVAYLWGDDSAFASATGRDGRARRWSLKPE